MSQQTWIFVAQFIALLSIPHAAALSAAKVLNTSDRAQLTLLAKVVEASAYATLAIVSGWTISVSRDSPLSELAELWHSIAIYSVIFAAVMMMIGGVVVNAKKARQAERWEDAVGSAGIVAFIVGVVALIALVAAGVNLDPNTSSGFSWTLLAVFGPGSVVVAAILLSRRSS